VARKAMILDAIQIFERNSRLDFTDCLLAVYASEDEHELTTFDRDLAAEGGVKVFGA
jgi:predicted nucleic acid-binding protein